MSGQFRRKWRENSHFSPDFPFNPGKTRDPGHLGTLWIVHRTQFPRAGIKVAWFLAKGAK
jgi:hypothetical protein